ncbi:aminopeptidase [Paenibacillus psychroresistens]|uniref:Aminopeptidase n=1 Tax=Paenibacillus psychroresistens TaxID=1778678 RepID=A0A6B8RLY5_9BACL|nr:aminopeptidase [Paenibacillus psychroresistens]QGQ96857.1 aminopeptidase [Paenibacillus psychroresistens]
MGDFHDSFEKYAMLAVEVGVNLQSGQTLCIISPVIAVEFVRKVTEHAYRIGANYVHVEWSDEQITRTRLELAPQEALAEFPLWRITGRIEMAKEGAAFLWIVAEDPNLLQGIDSQRIAISDNAQQHALQPFREFLQQNKVAWSIVAVPTQAWADTVYPNLEAGSRISALWEAIFMATRANVMQPVITWREHAQMLQAKAKWLNAQRFKSLHFRSPGTDLTIGLPDGHIWASAGAVNEAGTEFIPNMPTEEVFTSPIRTSVNGIVSSSKPLSYHGKLIDKFSFTFVDGRITEYQAEQGYEALKQLVETDEGSHYLGELALVPMDSPISNTNLIFNNTLFDENAACHLAIGFAFPFCLEGGLSMSQDQLREQGLNESLTHVDFMIGRANLDIDGLLPDGKKVPIFKNGNWFK